MKFVFGSLVDTIEALKKERLLFVLYVLFGLLPLWSASSFSPFVLKLLLLSVSLGWFVARFSLLNESLHKKKLSLNSLLSNVLESFVKVLPILIVMIIITLIPVFLLLLWYGRWFAQSYLNNGLGLSSQQVFVQLINALGDTSLWDEFFGQNIVMRVIYQVFLVFILTGLLISKLTSIFIAVQRFKGFDSVVKAFYYLSNHLVLLFSFIIFYIFGNVFFRVVLALYSNSVGSLAPQLYPVIYITLTACVWLFLDFYVLAYFNKTINTTSLKNRVMRWFRTKRN